MLQTKPIAPHILRTSVTHSGVTHSGIGKPRRAVGDPVAALKQMTRFIPVPQPAPANLSVPLSVLDPTASDSATKAGQLVFHCVGDTGGIHGTATQEAIAEAMENQINAAPANAKPAFFFHLGDVIYFNGQSTLYKSEFYEPYQYYAAPIFAIPGNHDGDTQVQKGDAPDSEPSLYGFMQNFCAPTAEYVSPYRMSITQPYVYWTLDAPFVTIIGLYSNVEGSLDARGRMDQQQYLQDQITKADPDKKLLIAVHHPCFSLDSAHGGTPDILNAIDRAISATGRIPDAVLSGHVHNYQRFTRTIQGKQVPYVVAGAGGYANDARSMHKLQTGITTASLPYQTSHSDVVLENFEQELSGFLRITASADAIQFEYFRVPFDGSTPDTDPFDTFSA